MRSHLSVPVIATVPVGGEDDDEDQFHQTPYHLLSRRAPAAQRCALADCTVDSTSRVVLLMSPPTPEQVAQDILKHTGSGNLRQAPRLLQAIVAALTSARRVVRIETLAEASHRGYLDHRADCRKGTTSETCTCGIMKWLPAGGTDD